ncbi:MAG: L,D-transpeptidase, partial [Mycobacterium sp.]|nr:L,D-transpeptidase [Mycobacterium sp.]
MSPTDPMPPLNRRRALAAIAVGLVAPGALAACTRDGGALAGDAGDAPAPPAVTYEPADASADVVPTARVG